MHTCKRLLIAWFFVPMHRFLFRLSGGDSWVNWRGTGSSSW